MGNSQTQSSRTKSSRVSHTSSCSRYLHQSSRSSVDSALLTEAHGLITDMLSDPALPSHVAGGLRAVASLLSPPSSSMPSSRSKPTVFASVAVNDNNRESDTEEIPYTGERPSSFAKVGQPLKSDKRENQYLQRGRRNMPPSLLRRMSTSTWSTTTSATGMPTVEPEPQRKRCTSFRNVPGLSSPNTSTPPSITSPLNPYPMKGRSYSTTALPAGTLQQLHERRERDLKTPFDLYSFDSNNSILSSSGDVRHRDNEADNEDDRQMIAFLKKHPKQNIPRFNLTSDYDSSNDSPSGSEATIDDSVLSSDTCASKILVNKRQLISSSDSGKSSASSSKSLRDRNECSLCGCKLHHSLMKERSIATNLEPVWPNIRPQPPVVPNIDQLGRYVIQDTTYDIEELATNPLLNRINEWDYPIFELNDAAGDAILSQLCYRIFLEAGLLEAFRIPIPEFLNYFRALEMGYKDKPYHNRMHAADVLQGVYYLTSQPIPGFAQIPIDSDESPLQKTSVGPLPPSYMKHISVCDNSQYGIMGANFPALELMALYTASAMHDYDHPGRTNAFLVSTFAAEAILYNDRSVLENHHAATAWSLFLSKPEFNWLRCLDKAEFKRFRFLVIELILATDLKRHFEILAEFNAKMNDDEAAGIDWLSETDRLLVIEMCVKLADINGPCKEHSIHIQWTHRIAEEFYEQGDEEERLGLPISPYMNRRNPQLAKLQESFINHLVAPLCNSYGEAGLLPGVWEYEQASTFEQSERSEDTQKCSETKGTVSMSAGKNSMRKIICYQTKHLQENYEYWINRMKEEAKSDCSPNTSSDGSSTPVFSPHLQGIAEAEESQASIESNSGESSHS